MAKTLKSILETYAPRSEDEKRFIDKHVVVKHADRNGNGDDVFKGKKIKIIKRAPEHGHEVGKDHEVYEGAQVSPEDTFLEDITESLKSRFVDALSSATGVDHYHTIQDAAKKLHDKSMREVNSRFPEGHPKRTAAVQMVRDLHRHIADSKNLTDMEHRSKAENLNKVLAPHLKALKEEALGETGPIAPETTLTEDVKKLSSEKLRALLKRADTDGSTPGASYAMQLKSARQELIRRRGTVKEDVKLNEESDLSEERAKSFAFTHTPGDADSEHRLLTLKRMAKAHNTSVTDDSHKVRIIARGRLGKDNPNSEKYRKGGEVWDKRAVKKWGYNEHGQWAPKTDGSKVRGSHNDISIKDSKHHDIYVAPKSLNWSDPKSNFDDNRKSARSASQTLVAAHRALHETAPAKPQEKSKPGKWKSTSHKLPDGRWASKDVKEETQTDPAAFLEEETVDYKHYRITAGQKTSNSEIGSPEHLTAHPGKMKALGVHTNKDDSYGRTSHVTVTNTTTGEQSHHNVYQREWGNDEDRPTVSIRHLKKIHPGHTNVLKHYLSGKTKLTEDVEQIDEAVYTGKSPSGLSDGLLARYKAAAHKSLDQVDRGGNQGKTKNRQRRNRINGLGKADMVTRPRYNQRSGS